MRKQNLHRELPLLKEQIFKYMSQKPLISGLDAADPAPFELSALSGCWVVTSGVLW